ncbi:MAG: 4'-phosphopantetheinyl transferase superfamily protein [Oscillospiraceae bacterium]|nr:4'-phosphopantetheinyl transferase superfamily protein [Oscillospiraceae bacterium]
MFNPETLSIDGANLYIYLIDNLQLVNDGYVADSLPRLPVLRREKYERYRDHTDRKACILAYLLLEAGLKERFEIDSFTLVCNDYGKPYLKEYPRIYFNITHCQTSVACVVADFEIGVDIEYIRPFDINIARQICGENELRRLSEADDPSKLFCRMWTEKESYAKSLGIDAASVFKMDLSDAKFIHWERETYYLTVCLGTKINGDITMFEKVKEIIQKTLDKNEFAITAETDILEELGVNSLELAELIYAFEDEFKINIPDRDIAKFRIIDDIVIYLNKKIK